MPIARFQLEDGRIARFEVPEGTTPEQAQSMMSDYFKQQPAQQSPQQAPQQEDQGGLAGWNRRMGQTIADVGIGALKGASDIGATLVSPLDKTGLTGMTTEERRQRLADFFKEHGSPESLAFKGGELAADIAGTAGAGGVIGKAALKGASIAPELAPKIAAALESGGFATNAAPGANIAEKAANAAIRVGGGAATGATSAGMINPDDALKGAAIGGALPAAGKVAGMAGEAIGKSFAVSPEVSALAQRAKELGIDVPADRLVNSPALNALSSSLRYMPLSGRAATEQKMEGQLQKALSRTFGQDTENITKALRDANTQLGQKFEETLKNNSVKIDDQFLNDATDTLEKAKNELSEGDFKIVENQINNVLAKAQNGTVDGAAAYNIKKDLDRIGARNSNEAWYANQLKKDLMGALNRSLGPEGAAEFAKVRQQYGNMLDLEPLAKAGAEGDISIARLANMRNINNPQLQEVADIAAQFVKPRESQHGAMQRVVLGSLGAGAAGAGFAAPVAIGLTGGRLANALLKSDVAKNAILAPKSNTKALAEALKNPLLRSAITAGD